MRGVEEKIEGRRKGRRAKCRSGKGRDKERWKRKEGGEEIKEQEKKK